MESDVEALGNLQREDQTITTEGNQVEPSKISKGWDG